MVLPDEKGYAEKWAKRLRGAVEDVKAGVDKVTEAPSKKAVSKKAKWVAKMTSKDVQDRWASRLERVTLDEWKAAMKDVGAMRISAGVDAARGDMEAFGKELLDHIKKGLGEIEKLPDITLEDNIARMEKFVKYMATFKRK